LESGSEEKKRRLPRFITFYKSIIFLQKMSARQKRVYGTPTPSGVLLKKMRTRESQVGRALAAGRGRAVLYRAPQLALRQRPANTEIKCFDVNPVGAPLAVFGAVAAAEPAVAFAGITELNCINQGATIAQRIANKVVIKSLHFKGILVGAGPNIGVARLMLIYDKQPNGAFPALTDILLDQPAGVASFNASLNIANKSRFAMIRDGFYALDAAQALIHHVSLYCKGRWECEFGANGNTIGDIRTGAVYLVAFYVNAMCTLNNMSCRVRYID